MDSLYVRPRQPFFFLDSKNPFLKFKKQKSTMQCSKWYSSARRNPKIFPFWLPQVVYTHRTVFVSTNPYPQYTYDHTKPLFICHYFTTPNWNSSLLPLFPWPCREEIDTPSFDVTFSRKDNRKPPPLLLQYVPALSFSLFPPQLCEKTTSFIS